MRSRIAILVTAILATVAVACGSEDSLTELNPEGPPDILQVFVQEQGPGATRISNLAFGTHRDRPDDDGVIDSAVVLKNRIHVIFDELLAGSTVEKFVCACDLNCPNGIRTTLTEGQCDDNPDTVENETGQWKDLNFDDVPDDKVLLPGIATIACAGAATPWVNGETEGWYNPSGNQFPPIDRNNLPVWELLGPALVLEPAQLPAGTDCSLTIASSVTDKQGESVPNPTTPIQFTTLPLGIVATSPGDGQTGVPMSLAQITITFSAGIDPTSIAGQVTLSGGITGTESLSMDGATVEFAIGNGPLTASTAYTVTVGTGITDVYGASLAAPLTFSFTTGTM